MGDTSKDKDNEGWSTSTLVLSFIASAMVVNGAIGAGGAWVKAADAFRHAGFESAITASRGTAEMRQAALADHAIGLRDGMVSAGVHVPERVLASVERLEEKRLQSDIARFGDLHGQGFEDGQSGRWSGRALGQYVFQISMLDDNIARDLRAAVRGIDREIGDAASIMTSRRTSENMRREFGVIASVVAAREILADHSGKLPESDDLLAGIPDRFAGVRKVIEEMRDGIRERIANLEEMSGPSLHDRAIGAMARERIAEMLEAKQSTPQEKTGLIDRFVPSREDLVQASMEVAIQDPFAPAPAVAAQDAPDPSP